MTMGKIVSTNSWVICSSMYHQMTSCPPSGISMQEWEETTDYGRRLLTKKQLKTALKMDSCSSSSPTSNFDSQIASKPPGSTPNWNIGNFWSSEPKLCVGRFLEECRHVSNSTLNECATTLQRLPGCPQPHEIVKVSWPRQHPNGTSKTWFSTIKHQSVYIDSLNEEELCSQRLQRCTEITGRHDWNHLPPKSTVWRLPHHSRILISLLPPGD